MQCLGVLTAHDGFFCNEYCRRAHKEYAEEHKEDKPIYVYMNLQMLELAKSEYIKPHSFSMFLYTGHSLVCVAKFEESELLTIGDEEATAYDGWWREVGQLNTSFKNIGDKDHRPLVMREIGILSYLCDEYGISTEKNIACAIGSIAYEEGITPIELFNTL